MVGFLYYSAAIEVDPNYCKLRFWVKVPLILTLEKLYALLGLRLTESLQKYHFGLQYSFSLVGIEVYRNSKITFKNN